MVVTIGNQILVNKESYFQLVCIVDIQYNNVSIRGKLYTLIVKVLKIPLHLKIQFYFQMKQALNGTLMLSSDWYLLNNYDIKTQPTPSQVIYVPTCGIN